MTQHAAAHLNIGLTRAGQRRHAGGKHLLEIAYLSLDGLKTFKSRRSPLAIINPREPFHILDAGTDWLMNWYTARVKDAILFGPAPAAIINQTVT